MAVLDFALLEPLFSFGNTTLPASFRFSGHIKGLINRPFKVKEKNRLCILPGHHRRKFALLAHRAPRLFAGVPEELYALRLLPNVKRAAKATNASELGSGTATTESSK